MIKEQLKNGIVEVVGKPADGEVGKTHYLPHHAVIRRDKATTKLRVVYDASARSNGAALNDCLYTGPPLAENIFDILLRFRASRIALTGDVEKAFLMVSIAEEDRDVLRFLWVDDIEKKNPEIVVLRFTRVVFGVCSSPFLLNATLKYHIERYKNEDPEFVDQFLRSIYVDDLSSGAADNNAAYELYLKCKLRLAEGGFNLRKFMSNSGQLIERIQQNEAHISAPAISANNDHMRSPSDLSKEDSVIEEDKTYAKSMLGTTEETSGAEQKVLGVRWNFVSDQFVLDLREIATLARKIEPSKRNVVSVTAKFYDPLGFLSPIITEFKIFFQELCKANWLGRTSRRRVEKRVVEAGHWIAMCKLIHSFKMLFPRSHREDCFLYSSWIWRCIQQSLCSSDIPTRHNNHGELCQILSLAIQSCSSETRDNPAINLLARLLRRDEG